MTESTNNSEVDLSASMMALTGLNDLGKILDSDIALRDEFVKDPIGTIRGSTLDFQLPGRSGQMFSDHLASISPQQRSSFTHFAAGSDPSIGDCDKEAMDTWVWTYGVIFVNIFANGNMQANVNVNTNLHINTQAWINTQTFGSGGADVA